jgi:hypothetical protein
MFSGSADFVKTVWGGVRICPSAFDDTGVTRDALDGPQQNRAEQSNPPADRPEHVVRPAEIAADPRRPEPRGRGPPLLPAQQQAEEDGPEPLPRPAVQEGGQVADEGGHTGGHRP